RYPRPAFPRKCSWCRTPDRPPDFVDDCRVIQQQLIVTIEAAHTTNNEKSCRDKGLWADVQIGQGEFRCAGRGRDPARQSESQLVARSARRIAWSNAPRKAERSRGVKLEL